MTKNFFSGLILLLSFITGCSQPNSINLAGEWNTYIQLRLAINRSPGTVQDHFYLDSQGNALYRINTTLEKYDSKQSHYLVKAEGTYKVDLADSLVYLHFNKFFYSDSSIVSKDIKTISKLSVYKRRKNSQKDFMIDEVVKFRLQIPMSDQYIRVNEDLAYNKRMETVMSEADFDKIKFIDWNKSKTQILAEIQKSPCIELLKLEAKEE